MSEWKRKRFWDAATAEERPEGYSVKLDARSVKTPAKQDLILPTGALAEAIAAEWEAQQGEIDPESMPLTRLANSTLDKVIPQFDQVAAHLSEYGENDLLCYRAERPEGLVARQSAQWDPVLAWLKDAHSIDLQVQSGIMPITQTREDAKVIRQITQALDPFALTAFHELVTGPGSWVLGLAVMQGHLPPEQAWDVAMVDELWQEEQWGADDEAQETRARKRQSFLFGHAFAQLSAGIDQ